MTGKERITRALRFESVDRVARQIWPQQAIYMFRKNEYEELLEKFPMDGVPVILEENPCKINENYIDEWGCVWETLEDGILGEVKYPPLKDLSKFNKYMPPYDFLENANWDKLQKQCDKNKDKFIIGTTTVRPFERMQYIRGVEDLYMDLAYGTKEILQLKDMLHEFFLKELEYWIKLDVDIITMQDDWGSQNSLLISPKMWREYFKPLYKEYIDLIHKSGKFVYFHTDGNIFSILADFVEIGVDAINSQLFTMDIEEIGRLYKGKITFWGEIDRQQILPFGSVEDVKSAVRRVRNALEVGHGGGVVAECEWGKDMPKENIYAMFEAWEK